MQYFRRFFFFLFLFFFFLIYILFFSCGGGFWNTSTAFFFLGGIGGLLIPNPRSVHPWLVLLRTYKEWPWEQDGQKQYDGSLRKVRRLQQLAVLAPYFFVFVDLIGVQSYYSCHQPHFFFNKRLNVLKLQYLSNEDELFFLSLSLLGRVFFF